MTRMANKIRKTRAANRAYFLVHLNLSGASESIWAQIELRKLCNGGWTNRNLKSRLALSVTGIRNKRLLSVPA